MLHITNKDGVGPAASQRLQWNRSVLTLSPPVWRTTTRLRQLLDGKFFNRTSNSSGCKWQVANGLPMPGPSKQPHNTHTKALPLATTNGLAAALPLHSPSTSPPCRSKFATHRQARPQLAYLSAVISSVASLVPLPVVAAPLLASVELQFFICHLTG